MSDEKQQTLVLNDDDFDDFDDTRVRMLAYYTARWSTDIRADTMDRHNLYDLYHWLLSQKSLSILKVVPTDPDRCRLLIDYLDKWGADPGDGMGAADLHDIKVTLEVSFHRNERTVKLLPDDKKNKKHGEGLKNSRMD